MIFLLKNTNTYKMEKYFTEGDNRLFNLNIENIAKDCNELCYVSLFANSISKQEEFSLGFRKNKKDKGYCIKITKEQATELIERLKLIRVNDAFTSSQSVWRDYHAILSKLDIATKEAKEAAAGAVVFGKEAFAYRAALNSISRDCWFEKQEEFLKSIIKTEFYDWKTI